MSARNLGETDTIVSFGITPHTELELLYIAAVQEPQIENYKSVMGVESFNSSTTTRFQPVFVSNFKKNLYQVESVSQQPPGTPQQNNIRRKATILAQPLPKQDASLTNASKQVTN